MTELGRWIDKKLEESDRTRDDLAEVMGIDVGTLDEIISGSIKRPPDARLEALAEFFGVSADVVKALISGKRLDEGAEVRSGDGQPNSGGWDALGHATTDRPLTSLACIAPSANAPGLRENLIVPVGRVESMNGAFTFNRESAELVLAAFRKHGTAIPIDIAHESLENRRAKAAGWIETLFFDPARGLLGLISWTAATREMLHADEMRYLSPVVVVRKSDGVVVKLESAAVTNKPAIPRMQKLAASRDASSLELQPNEQGNSSLENDPAVIIGQISALLGLEVADGDLGGAIRAILAKIKTMVSGPTAMSAEATENAALQRNLVELQTKLAERDADDLLRPFIRSAKINPRDDVDVAFCRKLAIADPDMFAHQMRIRKPFLELGRTEAPDAPTHHRSAMIANARREFQGDPSISRMTSEKAFCNLKLNEAGQGALTTDEAKLIGA
ncbi:MAG: phage protease [Phycisphaerae bacterium]